MLLLLLLHDILCYLFYCIWYCHLILCYYYLYLFGSIWYLLYLLCNFYLFVPTLFPDCTTAPHLQCVAVVAHVYLLRYVTVHLVFVAPVASLFALLPTRLVVAARCIAFYVTLRCCRYPFSVRSVVLRVCSVAFCLCLHWHLRCHCWLSHFHRVHVLLMLIVRFTAHRDTIAFDHPLLLTQAMFVDVTAIKFHLVFTVDDCICCCCCPTLRWCYWCYWHLIVLSFTFIVLVLLFIYVTILSHLHFITMRLFVIYLLLSHSIIYFICIVFIIVGIWCCICTCWRGVLLMVVLLLLQLMLLFCISVVVDTFYLLLHLFDDDDHLLFITMLVLFCCCWYCCCWYWLLTNWLICCWYITFTLFTVCYLMLFTRCLTFRHILFYIYLTLLTFVTVLFVRCCWARAVLMLLDALLFYDFAAFVAVVVVTLRVCCSWSHDFAVTLFTMGARCSVLIDVDVVVVDARLRCCCLFAVMVPTVVDCYVTFTRVLRCHFYAYVTLLLLYIRSLLRCCVAAVTFDRCYVVYALLFVYCVVTPYGVYLLTLVRVRFRLIVTVRGRGIICWNYICWQMLIVVLINCCCWYYDVTLITFVTDVIHSVTSFYCCCCYLFICWCYHCYCQRCCVVVCITFCFWYICCPVHCCSLHSTTVVPTLLSYRLPFVYHWYIDDGSHMVMGAHTLLTFDW